MEDEVIRFITGYVPLSDEEIRVVKAQNLIRSYRKDAVLLSEGETSKACYFVLRGCIRSYYLVDGEERSTEFYTENQSITPVSYVRKEPSLYYLSCVEDTVVAVGSEERNQQLIEQVPALTSLLLQLNSELLVENRLSLDNFKNLSPEERYLHLLDTRPELLNRVPLAYLATYLGITPVSLSRMRKRILKKG